MYNISRLRLLREVSLRGTLAAAAQALGYHPSSISHQLKLLEHDTGVVLLEPVGRGIRLTKEAAVLVHHTEAILRHLESAEAEISQLRHSVSGTVRLATFQTAAHTVIPPTLLTLRHAHPELRVTVAHISAELALPAMLARDFDLVLQEEYPSHPRKTVHGADLASAGTDPLWLVTPAQDNARHVSDLAERDWVMEPTGTLARGWAASECRKAGFEPRVAYESSDLLLHVRLAAAGLAVAFVPGLALAGCDTGEVATHPIAGDPVRHITTAVRQGGGSAPAVAAVRTAIARALEE